MQRTSQSQHAAAEDLLTGNPALIRVFSALVASCDGRKFPRFSYCWAESIWSLR